MRYLLTCFCFLPIILFAQERPEIDPDNAREALSELQAYRADLVLTARADWANQAHEMLKTGLWQIALDSIRSHHDTPDAKWLLAEWNFLQHEYAKSEELIRPLIKSLYTDKALKRHLWLLQAKLHIQAWELEKAFRVLNRMMVDFPDDVAANYWMGKYYLLQKKYEEALMISHQIQRKDLEAYEGYLLEAETRLWMRQIDLARVVLKQALEKNPFSATARFWYGYATWREIDATKLPNMAAQWQITLELDPLNYLTHWHWGNGHTHLKFENYIDSTDGQALASLTEIERLLAKEAYQEALKTTTSIMKEFPSSVHPPMFRGSAFYNLASLNPQYLDSATADFQHILEFRSNYGPAHNGIAAVIKKKQFRYLLMADSLEKAIASVEIPEKWQSIFANIFPDVGQYPTDRTAKMVWSQLFSAKAYLPMLQILERKFVIPALHTDLATAMNNKWFQTGVVFDNRQWMDIRGVGSGAAGIEYVERGSHLERNVTLHEFAHLFHFTVLTEREKSRILQLYYEAMRDGKVIDYYAENNDAEYFAQAYTAYFSEQRIHPQNHKSMNTRYDLQEKDPNMYAFVDSLVKNTDAFLAGNESTLADNLAQTYVTKAEAGKTLRGWGFAESDKERARGYYQKAIEVSPNYMPAKLGLISLDLAEGKLKRAKTALEVILNENSDCPQAYLLKAELLDAQLASRDLNIEEAIEGKAKSYQMAYRYASDWQQKGEMYDALIRFYQNNTLVDSAISLSLQYAGLVSKSEFIKPLQMAENRALAYAHWQKGKLGYADKSLPALRRLTEKHPESTQFRKQYAEVLACNEQVEEAVATLQDALRYLKPNQYKERNDISIQIAECYLTLHKKDKAKELVMPMAEVKNPNTSDLYRLISVLAFVDLAENAENLMKDIPPASTIYEQSAYAYAKAQVMRGKGNEAEAIDLLQQAIVKNPYNIEARLGLVRLLRLGKHKHQAKLLVHEAQKLSIPPTGKLAQTLNDLTK